MFLLDHVSITVRELARVRSFYQAVMGALGAEKIYERADAVGYGTRNRADDDAHSYLSVFESAAASPDQRRHWCFRAQSAQAVRRFHGAALEAGGSDLGAPGPRAHYHPGYYAAFVADPEGNRLEAVWHRASASADAS